MAKKTCFKCLREKPIRDFYRHPQMADGHLGKCKECTKSDVQRNYKSTRSERAAYERRREETPQRRADKSRFGKRYRSRHPDRCAARAAVSYALRSGRLVRGPCCVCGTRKRVQAHHADYSKPLAVEWLCFKCHREGRHGQITT